MWMLGINAFGRFLKANLNSTLDGIRFGFKTLRIYISAHVVSTSFKFNSMFVDKHGQGKGGVLENKTKGDRKNSKLRREDLNA